MASDRWTQDQLKLAFFLYCQLPFGQLHKGNREIIRLAELIGRTPSAVAMKLCNIASLDPAITSSGRKGLSGASSLDRKIWQEFHADWDRLVVECERLRAAFTPEMELVSGGDNDTSDNATREDYTGHTKRVLVEQRIGQRFFRQAVLSGYRERCCMSGLSEPRLLVASHIVPWSKDNANRLNPSNGLCLSAIHDKAFDAGLVTLSDDYRVTLSVELRMCNDSFVRQVLHPLEGKKIELPERFLPGLGFIARHRREILPTRKQGRK